MRVHLGGHLNWYDPQKRAWQELALAEPVSLTELLQLLRVPPDEIGVAAVNGNAVSLEDAVVSDGDCVEFYPPIGGGYLMPI